MTIYFSTTLIHIDACLASITLLRKVLESRVEPRYGAPWPEECRIRATFLKSLVLEALGNGQEAGNCRTAATTRLRQLLSTHLPDLANQTPLHVNNAFQNELLVLFDHAVPYFAGKFTVGQLHGSRSTGRVREGLVSAPV